MERVKIFFQNIQSHESTTFFLEPGINFILAEDNNVGKSTIFKVFSCIAKAPGVSGRKLDALIRYGCSEAVAAFHYRGEGVIAKFTRYKGEAPKLFFEHQHASGEITRSLVCPRGLLDALGIVVGENGEIINFNDADSVQLISEISAEADTIITHVMLDPKIERVKANMQILAREINADLRKLGGEIEAYERTLSELHFQPAVAEFDDRLPELEALCRLCDTLPQNLPEASDFIPVGQERVECLPQMLRLLEGVTHYLECDTREVRGQREAAATVRILQALSKQPFDLAQVQSVLPAGANLGACKNICYIANKLKKVSLDVKSLGEETATVTSLAFERQELLQEILKRSEIVQCPVKGQVLYSNEECLPYRS